MKYETVQFPGGAGKHCNVEGQDCPGRQFHVRVIGRGAMSTNCVECLSCHGHYEAYEDRLANGTPGHSIP